MLIDEWLNRFARPVFDKDGDKGGGSGDDGQDGQDGGDAGGQDGGQDDKKPSAEDIKAGLDGGAFKKEAGSDEGGDGGGSGSDDKGGSGSDDGQRPEWLPEKFFKDGKPQVEDLAKAYAKSESALSKLKNEENPLKGKVPDDASGYFADGIKLPDEVDRIEQIADDDPGLSVFRDVMHKHNIPTEVAQAIAVDFLTGVNGHLELGETPEQIVEGLGKQGAAIKEGAETWMDSLYNNGQISADELSLMYEFFGSSAAGVRLLGKLRALSGEEPIPLGDPQGEGLWSVEEWQAAVRSDEYGNDPSFRAKVDRMGEQLTKAGQNLSAGPGVPPVRAHDRREMSVTRR